VVAPVARTSTASTNGSSYMSFAANILDILGLQFRMSVSVHVTPDYEKRLNVWGPIIEVRFSVMFYILLKN